MKTRAVKGGKRKRNDRQKGLAITYTVPYASKQAHDERYKKGEVKARFRVIPSEE